jgi:hypothetical protein
MLVGKAICHRHRKVTKEVYSMYYSRWTARVTSMSLVDKLHGVFFGVEFCREHVAFPLNIT